MTLRELWTKLLTISGVAAQKDVSTPMYFTTPQVLDAKVVGWPTSQAEPGKGCNTCTHYHLRVEILEGELTPPAPRHDYDEEELINMVKLPVYFGFCSKIMGKHNVLLYGIRSDHGCPHWWEKPAHEQFDDNVIEEDDGRTPVVPTRIVGV